MLLRPGDNQSPGMAGVARTGDTSPGSAPSRIPGRRALPLPLPSRVSRTGQTRMADLQRIAPAAWAQSLFSRRWLCRLKPLAALVGVLGVGLWCALAAVHGRPNVVKKPRERAFVDDGPGELWMPPEERPVPLSLFPKFAGVNSVGKSKRVQSRAGVEEGQDRPPVTLLFMHLWKCAGSSLRHMLREWAELEEQSIGIVVRCGEEFAEAGKVCLQDHQLINAQTQGPYLRQNQVLAGHFTWGFQYHVRQPYVMFTTLRNPLELFVSGQQYLNRKATKRLSNAVELVGATMRTSVDNYKSRLRATEEGLVIPEGQGGKAIGFIYRLVEPEVIATNTLAEAAQQARDNLDTFWLVGVVEQYRGFMGVLREMMDPFRRHKRLWKSYEVGKYNTSPNGAGKVLAGIEASNPGLVKEFNDTIRHQWEVYDYAVGLFYNRCREILHTRDYDLCGVPVAASEYSMTELEREQLYQGLHPTMTDLEQEKLYQDLHPAAVSFNASEILRAKALWSSRHDGLYGLATGPPYLEESVRRFFEAHGFDLSDAERKDKLWERLGIFESISRSPVGWPGGGDRMESDVVVNISHGGGYNASEVRPGGNNLLVERNASHAVKGSTEPSWSVENASKFLENNNGFNLSIADRKDKSLDLESISRFSERRSGGEGVVEMAHGERLSLPDPRSGGVGYHANEVSRASEDAWMKRNASRALTACSDPSSRAKDLSRISNAKETQERDRSKERPVGLRPEGADLPPLSMLDEDALVREQNAP